MHAQGFDAVPTSMPQMLVKRTQIVEDDSNQFMQQYFFADRPEDVVTVRTGKKFKQPGRYWVEVSCASNRIADATSAMMFAQLWMYAAQFVASLQAQDLYSK